MSKLPFETLPDYPNPNASGVLVRMIDALGFRYYWATDGLRPSDMDTRPTPEAFSLWELLLHLNALCSIIDSSLGGPAFKDKLAPESFDELRKTTLHYLHNARKRIMQQDDGTVLKAELVRGDKTFPLWNIISGPLADALTHVGQVNTYRRLNGNPATAINYLEGRRRTP